MSSSFDSQKYTALANDLLPEYEQVQVYKDAFDLLVFVYRTTHRLRREQRFTLGEEMKRVLSDMLTCIYEARKAPRERVLIIEEAMHYCYKAKVLFRVMLELRLLKDWHVAFYVSHLSSVSKQLSAWHRYERRKTQQQSKDTTSAQPATVSQWGCTESDHRSMAT